MPEHDKVLWTLDNETQPGTFERLCVDLLGREGYRHINPIGGSKDQGKDAEIRYWTGSGDGCSAIIFQFSLMDDWERKLKKDAKKIAKNCPETLAMVFVTSQKVSGSKQNKLRNAFNSSFDWELTIYSREWLRHRLTEYHQDLTKKYLGLDLPPTVCHATTLIELSGFDEDSAKEIFQETSRDLVRSSILERTRKEPFVVANWYNLARIEYLLRNYDAALEAVNKALALKAPDSVLNFNIVLWKGAILAEKGVQTRSLPLLVQAKEIFLMATQKLKRAVDHYNLANVLCALGELKEARNHYLQCVKLKPDYAEAWKNFGSLFIQKRKLGWGMECFEKALKYKPNLVEAYLSKGTALLHFYKQPAEAIICFETAYKIDSEIDRKWKYIRYWYSKALTTAGRDVEALRQTEIELLIRPDDLYLLNQKASVLSKLRKQSQAYEEQALEFLKFRAHTIPKDYPGLAELIEIYTQQGKPDDAWPLIDTNIACGPFVLHQIAEKAEIPIADFQIGFRYSRLYQMFRQRFSVEDHCITFQGYGLSPSNKLLAGLNQSLIAPFGVAAQKLNKLSDNKSADDLQAIWSTSLNAISLLFPVFGSFWLAKNKPSERDEQIKLASMGILYLFDVVVAEAARHFGFLAGHRGFSREQIEQSQKQDWKGLRIEVGVRLFERVALDWQMIKPK